VSYRECRGGAGPAVRAAGVRPRPRGEPAACTGPARPGRTRAGVRGDASSRFRGDETRARRAILGGDAAASRPGRGPPGAPAGRTAGSAGSSGRSGRVVPQPRGVLPQPGAARGDGRGDPPGARGGAADLGGHAGGRAGERARRVTESTSSSVTLILQDEFLPFEQGKSGISMRALRLHRLPWPDQQLRDLFSARVRLRVTLSYFVEPNPSSRGWQGRYRYASPACASTSSVRQRLSRSSSVVSGTRQRKRRPARRLGLAAQTTDGRSARGRATSARCTPTSGPGPAPSSRRADTSRDYPGRRLVEGQVEGQQPP